MSITRLKGSSGGGFALGSSYISASTGSVTGLVFGAPFVPPPFTLNTLVGSDFEIDGGDPSKINALVDCWVDITISFAFGTEDPVLWPLTTFILDITIGGNFSSTDGTLNVEDIAAAAGVTYWGETHRTPYAHMNAGDSIQWPFANISSAGFGGVGTWFVDEFDIQVMRVS